MKKIILLVFLIAVSASAFAQYTHSNIVTINPSNYGPKLILDDSNTGNKVPIEFRANNVIKWEFGQRNGSEGHNLALWRYNGSYIRVMTWDQSNGNVGIGTTSPLAPLSFNNTTGNKIDLYYNTANGGDRYGLQVQSSELRIHSGAVGNSTGGITFGKQSTSSFTENVRFTNAGNVGIGTTTPGEKLEVNGTIRSKKVKVEATGWPDYVFEKNYELRDINELEAYIKENKHLPEVPSAKDLEEKGLDLGSMDATLLKKVEELTLYLIDMKKEIEGLKKENEKLKSAFAQASGDEKKKK